MINEYTWCAAYFAQWAVVDRKFWSQWLGHKAFGQSVYGLYVLYFLSVRLLFPMTKAASDSFGKISWQRSEISSHASLPLLHLPLLAVVLFSSSFVCLFVRRWIVVVSMEQVDYRPDKSWLKYGTLKFTFGIMVRSKVITSDVPNISFW